MQKIIITCPSLDSDKNISGISSVTKFIIKNNNEYAYTHFELGKTDYEVRDLSWFFRNVKAWLDWFWLMINQRNILVHFNMSLTMRSVLRDLPLLIFTQISGKPLIIHVHGGDFLESRVPPWWISLLLKMCFSTKHLKIVLSETEKKLLISRFNAKEVHVLPNCIDLTDARKFVGEKKVTLPLKIIYLGRIDINKGLDYILSALERLNSKMPGSFIFTIAGTGPDKDRYLSKFSERLGSSFRYAGVVRGKIKSDLLRDSHVFLLPSLYEGLPIALLENMAYGNVPVVTDVGSIGTLVSDRDNGIIVTKKSADDIFNALQQLITETVFAEHLGSNARSLIFRLINPEGYISELNSMYARAKGIKPVVSQQPEAVKPESPPLKNSEIKVTKRMY